MDLGNAYEIHQCVLRVQSDCRHRGPGSPRRLGEAKILKIYPAFQLPGLSPKPCRSQNPFNSHAPLVARVRGPALSFVRLGGAGGGLDGDEQVGGDGGCALDEDLYVPGVNSSQLPKACSMRTDADQMETDSSTAAILSPWSTGLAFSRFFFNDR